MVAFEFYSHQQNDIWTIIISVLLYKQANSLGDQKAKLFNAKSHYTNLWYAVINCTVIRFDISLLQNYRLPFGISIQILSYKWCWIILTTYVLFGRLH